MARLWDWAYALVVFLERLVLLPARLLLNNSRLQSWPVTRFLALSLALLLLGLSYPSLWWCHGLLFVICLSVSVLHHKIYQEQRNIIEGLCTEQDAVWLTYDSTLRAAFLYCNYPLLLMSLILLLRQATLLWGSAVFNPPEIRLELWALYALDLIFKAVLFDIPEIYRIDLVTMQHVGFWGGTLVFVSRLVVLVLFVGALLRWKEIYTMVYDTVACLDKCIQPPTLIGSAPQDNTDEVAEANLDRQQEMSELRLLLVIRMFPAQINRLVHWATHVNFSLDTRVALIEILGKTRNMAVLPIWEKWLGHEPAPELRLQVAILRSMAFLGQGHPVLLVPILSSSATYPAALTQQACKTLQAWNTDDSVGLLCQVMREHPDAALRCVAIRSLGNTQSPLALAALLEIMQNGSISKEERFLAKDSIVAIGNLSSDIRQALAQELTSSVYPDNRRFAAMVLGKLCDRLDLPLLASRLQQEQDPDTQTYLVQAIGNIAHAGQQRDSGVSTDWPELAAAVKRKALPNEIIFVRVAAIQALTDIAGSGGHDQLTQEIALWLQQLAKESDTQLADAAQEGLLRIAQVATIEVQSRRECITAVGIGDLAWRDVSGHVPRETPSHLGPTVGNRPDQGDNMHISTVYPPREITTHAAPAPQTISIEPKQEQRPVTKSAPITVVPQGAESAKYLAAFPVSLTTRYQAVAKLSHGKVSVVYRVWDIQDQCEKVLKYLALQQNWARELFFKEVKILQTLQHPGIIPILEVYQTEALFAFTMPWIGAPTLFTMSSQKKAARQLWSLPEIAQILSSLCEVVMAVHKSGWCHGDLKPENILYRRERLVLLDFNSAYAVAAGDSILTTGIPMGGTPYYMAPEQMQQSHCDQRTDIYALGIIAYELITGVLPMGIHPPSVQKLRHEAVPQTQVVLSRATAFRREDRFATVAEFWQELTKSLECV